MDREARLLGELAVIGPNSEFNFTVITDDFLIEEPS